MLVWYSPKSGCRKAPGNITIYRGLANSLLLITALPADNFMR